MNTESAAICCGNRPSTHRSGHPVLVCRSCGDQLQGETAEATIAAWNRAKSPAVTTMAFQIHRLGEFLLANFGPLSVTDGEQETVCRMAERALEAQLDGLRRAEIESHRFHRFEQSAERRIAELEGEVSDGIDERDKLSRQLQRARAEHIYCGQGQKPAIKPGNYRSSEAIVQNLFEDMAARSGFGALLDQLSAEQTEKIRIEWANILNEDAAYADESRRDEIEAEARRKERDLRRQLFEAQEQLRKAENERDGLRSLLASNEADMDTWRTWTAEAEKAKNRAEAALRGSEELARITNGDPDGLSLCERAAAFLTRVREERTNWHDRYREAEAQIAEQLNWRDRAIKAEDRVADLSVEKTELESRADANWHEGERLRGQLAKAEENCARLIADRGLSAPLVTPDGFIHIHVHVSNPQANQGAVQCEQPLRVGDMLQQGYTVEEILKAGREGAQ
jgi:hypothetical protein